VFICTECDTNNADAGVQHIHNIAPLGAAERADDAEAVQHNQPVRFLLQFPPRVQHNFAANKYDALF
jgi:hypothetical protein